MWNAFVRIAVFSAFFSLSFLYVSSNDPFGIDDAVDQQARNILYRAFASSYDDAGADADEFSPDRELADLWVPPAPLDPESTELRPVHAQDEIVTVYLSDQVLRSLREQNQTTDEDVPGSWQAWRPSYFDHAELVYSLATIWQQRPDASSITPDAENVRIRKPPAIFFDFIFLEVGATADEREFFKFFIGEVAAITRHGEWLDNLDPRGREIGCDDPYMRLVCIKAAGGIPLIFARGDNPGMIAMDTNIEPAQQRLNEVAIIAPVRFVNQPGDYPVKSDSYSDAEREALRRENPTREIIEYPTPAALMYLSWCMDNKGQCRWLEPDMRGELNVSDIARLRHMAQTFARRDFDPISLRWGVAVPRYFAALERTVTGYRPGLVRSGAFGDTPIHPGEPGSQTTCRMENGQGFNGLWTGASMVMRQATINGRNSAIDSLAQQCAYHLEVPYPIIRSDALTFDVARSIFDGRVIVVGARFRNSGDIIRSPVHSQLPGLHGHAMATDNLIAKHNAYLRSPQGSWFLLGSADALDYLETGVMFIVLLIVASGQWWLNQRLINEEASLSEDPREGDRPSHWVAYFLVITAVAVSVLLIAIIQIIYLRMAPLNWISITATAVGVFIFLLRDEIGDDVSRFLRRTPTINKVGNPLLDWLSNYRKYMDLETIGFEKGTSNLDEARKEKDRVVARLYPELAKDRDAAQDNSGRAPPV